MVQRTQYRMTIFISLFLAVQHFAILTEKSMAQESTERGPRIGADDKRPVRLTINEVITLALESNNDIELVRIGVQLREFAQQEAQAAYDPEFQSSFSYDRRSMPVASLLAGNLSGQAQTTDLLISAALDRKLPWNGARVRFGFDQNRMTSNNQFFSLNPQFTTQLGVSFVQPLARDRRIDLARRQIVIARHELAMSDNQFRQRVIEIVSQVQLAYWALVYARRNEEIKREAVELGQNQLAQNERMVEKGLLAPADVISARLEVERRTDEVEVAVDAVHRAENSLKELIASSGRRDLWDFVLIPVDIADAEMKQILPLDDALSLAFNNRPEMEQYRLRQKLNDVDIDYFRDQIRPQINLFAGYTIFGLAGRTRTVANPLVASHSALHSQVNKLSAATGLPLIAPPLLEVLPERFNGGYWDSLGRLLGQHDRAWRFGLNMTLPFGNRAAKAQYGRALAENRRIEVESRAVQRRIEVEVRNSLQAVESARRRGENARAALRHAELQYQSEQRRFAAGGTTNYFVLDRQNAVSAARGRELKALTDYQKALIELNRAMATTLVSQSIVVKAR